MRASAAGPADVYVQARHSCMNLPFSLRQRSAAAYGSAVAVLVVGIAALTSLQRQRQADALVQHTYRVLDAVAAALTRAGDARLAERTFLIAGDRDQLATYRSAVHDTRQAFASLRTLTADNVDEQQRLDRMRPLLDAYLAPFDSSDGYRPPARADVILREFSDSQTVATRNALHDVAGEMGTEGSRSCAPGPWRLGRSSA